jgi:hypothetical protein
MADARGAAGAATRIMSSAFRPGEAAGRSLSYVDNFCKQNQSARSVQLVIHACTYTLVIERRDIAWIKVRRWRSIGGRAYLQAGGCNCRRAAGKDLEKLKAGGGTRPVVGVPATTRAHR